MRRSTALALSTWPVLICLVAFADTPGKDRAARALRQFRAGKPNAYQEVISAGEAAVDGLAKILGDKKADGTLRFTAANALGDIGSRKAVGPLLRALKDPYFNVRRCAALALGKIGDKSARRALVKLAREDPFAWRDPKTGKVRHLVREEARKALDILAGRATPETAGLRKEKETFLKDAAKPPASPVKVRMRRLGWPFKGGFRDQNVWNNYQQPTDQYVHAGLDFIQPAGAEVLAVEGGYVAAIATNYPKSKTHHFFIVTPKKSGDEGWCYTHVDPASYTFKVGDEVRKGQALGKLVKFYVGKNRGADHLHLHYVRFKKTGAGKVDVHSLVDPLLFFDWKDSAPPAIDKQFHFVREGTLDEFPAGPDGLARVSGMVDVIVGISDNAHKDHACTWMVPVVTLEIAGDEAKPWRKLVLDQRGPVENPRAASVLYVSNKDKQRWLKGRPRFPVVHFVKATNTDGDGIIEPADRMQTWDTAQRDQKGRRRFPDGLYRVTVRAWDLKGNLGSRTVSVRVRNLRGK